MRVRAFVTHVVRPGQVFIPTHFAETNAGKSGPQLDANARRRNVIAMGLMSNLRNATDILRHVRGPGALVDAVRQKPARVLNDGPAAATQPEVDASSVAQRLRSLRDNLKAAVLSPDGRIDYAQLQGHDVLDELRQTTPLLNSVTPEHLTSDEERNAFFINIYNVLALDGVLALEIKRSVMELPAFFGSIAYRIGGELFTPDDIENGVCRCNSPHPFTKKKLFAPNDSRLAYCPSKLDPRVHSALVCASKSCPAVRFYEADKLDAQLDQATHVYVNAGTTVNHEKKEVWLPITFDYYGDDFGGPARLLDFVTGYAEDELLESVKRAKADDYRIRFSRYDWSLNGVA